MQLPMTIYEIIPMEHTFWGWTLCKTYWLYAQPQNMQTKPVKGDKFKANFKIVDQ
jgi:hypothetical protein